MCGAGDIYATTKGERVNAGYYFILTYSVIICFVQIFCVFLFVCAASLFGTIIAESNEIISTLTTKRKNLEDILEPYLTVNPR
jgi:hypothetical protein